jgi:hypothetical protein
MVCDAWEKALGTAPATATVPDERPMLKVTALQPDKFLFYSQIIHELCFFSHSLAHSTNKRGCHTGAGNKALRAASVNTLQENIQQAPALPSLDDHRRRQSSRPANGLRSSKKGRRQKLCSGEEAIQCYIKDSLRSLTGGMAWWMIAHRRHAIGGP